MSEERQIEELEEILLKACDAKPNGRCIKKLCSKCRAETVIEEGYRKQRDGEWQIKTEIHRMLDDVDEEIYVECPFCKRTFWVPYEFEDKKIFEYAREHYPYCNCGAKMKGGE